LALLLPRIGNGFSVELNGQLRLQRGMNRSPRQCLEVCWATGMKPSPSMASSWLPMAMNHTLSARRNRSA
jgi:hypothetical protein